MRTPTSRHLITRERPLGEEGVALPLALLVLLVLSILAVALAEMTAAEVDVGRWTRWDQQAQYLAQAAIEHQVYALKADKAAAAVGPVNYPATPGAEYWYSTTLTCLLQCAADREVRRWRIIGTGEIRTPGGAVLQRRAVRAEVEIAYAWGSTGPTAGFIVPATVTYLRWEEVYP
ncbi:MAG: hypothetical protein RB148_08675 [Armatimonadota bacterium]|nr:hypothetical protein [Armatimonadota bacterium]MDR7470791.1 hypothetical protein [Armatimonadota bacterium]